MSDTTARRVSWFEAQYSNPDIHTVRDDPHGTHVLVTVEEWERLRGIIAARDQYACEAYKRIAELEEERTFTDGHCYMSHHITDAQLQAAVATANALEENDHCGDGWAMLNHLGFERCKCEGAAHLGECNGIGAIASQTTNEKRSADDE